VERQLLTPCAIGRACSSKSVEILGSSSPQELHLPGCTADIVSRSYREDFILQYRHYESLRDIFMLEPTSAATAGVISFKDLIDFVAHVADNYPDVAATFPGDLIRLLETHHAVLDPELREKLVTSLVLLRRKDVMSSELLLQTLFPILTMTRSKNLRILLLQKILADIRNANSKSTNHKLNRSAQNALYTLLSSDRTSPRALWTVKLTRELWKRQVWKDAKAVDIMKEACMSENPKVIIAGARFFLGSDQDRADFEDESSDEEDIDIKQVKHQMGINKKTKKKVKLLDKAVEKLKKRERNKNQLPQLNFSALHLLNDPQGFAETLFFKHLSKATSKMNLEQRLIVLQLVSRLVGMHRLTIINLYSYFLKYLNPKQPSVTSFLASLAQATHALVPPDVLEPLVRKIANEFVSEAAASEVACVGLNAIRELCMRQPLALEDDLLQDLVMYKKSKDKGVSMAARGLLSLYREVGAEMLRKRDRGKNATVSLKSGEQKIRRFGEEEGGVIEGIELLEAWKEEELRKKLEAAGINPDDPQAEEFEAEENNNWAAWEVESADDESEDGWIAVSSDGELDISDSEDERQAKKPKLAKDDAAKSEQENIAPIDGEAKAEAKKTNGETEPKFSSLATTKILTPADLAKLQELRMEAGVDKLMGRKKRLLEKYVFNHLCFLLYEY
jgi:protein SDA1